MRHNQLFLLIAFVATALLSGACCADKSSNSIPADKKEIMDRFVAGTLDPSYTPALFWGHFGSGKKLGEEAVKAHLQFYLKGGADMLKVQTEQ